MRPASLWPLLLLRAALRGRAEPARLPRPVLAAVAGIDKDVRSSLPFGDFYRPLAPGDYTVTVTSRGYTSYSANVTVPADGSGASLRVALRQL